MLRNKELNAVIALKSVVIHSRKIVIKRKIKKNDNYIMNVNTSSLF